MCPVKVSDADNSDVHSYTGTFHTLHELIDDNARFETVASGDIAALLFF